MLINLNTNSEIISISLGEFMKKNNHHTHTTAERKEQKHQAKHPGKNDHSDNYANPKEQLKTQEKIQSQQFE